MAIILKQGGEFTPEFERTTGAKVVCTTYYGAIDRVEYNKGDDDCSFMVAVYSDKEHRDSDSHVVDFVNINVHGEDFAETIGKDGVTIAEAYALALQDERLKDFISDEA